MNSLFKPAKTVEAGSILNLDFFTNKENTVGMTTTGIGSISESESTTSTGKKRGRPKKNTSDDINNMVPADEPQGNLPLHQSNEPYLDTYNATNMMVQGTISEVDGLNNMILTELKAIQNSKTLKRKYDYISQLAGTSSTLIGTKLSAIKELNKVITDTHNLELKRIKDLKLNVSNEVDDNKYIMDMYNAFINTPVGSYNSMNTPSISDMTMLTGVTGVTKTPMVNTSNTFDDYINNMNPIQNMMMLEQNQNVKTVVVYDASTGNRWFDVVDITTGESIPNVDKPDAMFLEDTTLDTRNGIARNVNLDTTYPLIILNNNIMTEY